MADEQGCIPHGHIHCTACAEEAELAALRAAPAEQAATIARLEGELALSHKRLDETRILLDVAMGQREQAEAERDALTARVAELEQVLLRPLMTTEARRLRGDIHAALQGAKTDGDV